MTADLLFFVILVGAYWAWREAAMRRRKRTQ